ncbi:unnamed protein product [Microthlaspi erraticum]|uniref:Uncharacterized protein n=1 Tax=Microthlaspi erraticum TaxID=1685480 RepID=A0A6D2IRS9_9BRAS|nr:unnamed protein product [Microthlaspi erraticum]
MHGRQGEPEEAHGGAEEKRTNARRESVPADLEAEETKGFTDLGFVFTEEDLNSELPEILPGLRTFLHGEEESKTEWSVPRPYLSEAWDFYSDKWSGRTEKESVVIDLRIAALCGETNMKDSLKWWARSVASNLK